MTRDEILNMEAGREMDALVAEKVMGWRNDESVPYFDWVMDNELIHVSRRWSPSTDIAAAWQVVEKLDDLDGYGVWAIGSGGGIRGHWDVNLALSENESFWAFADTAPLAICRAALLAVLE